MRWRNVKRMIWKPKIIESTTGPSARPKKANLLTMSEEPQLSQLSQNYLRARVRRLHKISSATQVCSQAASDIYPVASTRWQSGDAALQRPHSRSYRALLPCFAAYHGNLIAIKCGVPRQRHNIHIPTGLFRRAHCEVSWFFLG